MFRKRYYDLIVFDWDGTLMDSMAGTAQSLSAAAKDVGVPAPDRDAFRHLAGVGLEEIGAALFPELSKHQRE